MGERPGIAEEICGRRRDSAAQGRVCQPALVWVVGPGPIGDRTTCPGDVEGGCWGGASRRRWSRLDRENRCGGQWRIDTVVDNGQGRAQPDGDGQRGSRADEVAAHRAFVPDS